jgi:hypothetical protein
MPQSPTAVTNDCGGDVVSSMGGGGRGMHKNNKRVPDGGLRLPLSSLLLRPAQGLVCGGGGVGGVRAVHSWRALESLVANNSTFLLPSSSIVEIVVLHFSALSNGRQQRHQQCGICSHHRHIVRHWACPKAHVHALISYSCYFFGPQLDQSKRGSTAKSLQISHWREN